jgi:hypothetical protein
MVSFIAAGSTGHSPSRRGSWVAGWRRCSLGKNGDGSGGHQKPVRRRAVADPYGNGQRVPVHGTQLVQFFLIDRKEELIEPGKGQIGLQFHPGGAQHLGLGRRRRIGRRVQQHRLASARLTAQQ